jgi:hypothetical protein
MAEDLSRSRSGGQGRPCSTLCALPTPSCSTCSGEEHMQIEMRWYMPWRGWVLVPLNCHLRGLHLIPCTYGLETTPRTTQLPPSHPPRSTGRCHRLVRRQACRLFAFAGAFSQNLRHRDGSRSGVVRALMLTILISGPKQPGVDIDVFLEPLM